MLCTSEMHSFFYLLVVRDKSSTLQHATDVHLRKIHEIKTKISNYISDVAVQFSSRRLQLNTDEIDLIWFGSRTNLNKTASQD
jgi:hypothetical protein